MATLRSAAGVPVGFRCHRKPRRAGASLGAEAICRSRPRRAAASSPTRRPACSDVYIKSKVADNKYLGADYVQRIKASGGEALERAWLHGDWSGDPGRILHRVVSADCIITPFTIPTGLAPVPIDGLRLCNARSAIHWWAIPTDDYQHDGRIAASRCTRRSISEWYGSNGEPNVGLRLTAEEVAAGIKAAGRRARPDTAFSIPRAFAEAGGPSIAERLARGVASYSARPTTSACRTSAMSAAGTR